MNSRNCQQIDSSIGLQVSISFDTKKNICGKLPATLKPIQ